MQISQSKKLSRSEKEGQFNELRENKSEQGVQSKELRAWISEQGVQGN